MKALKEYVFLVMYYLMPNSWFQKPNIQKPDKLCVPNASGIHYRQGLKIILHYKFDDLCF